MLPSVWSFAPLGTFRSAWGARSVTPFNASYLPPYFPLNTALRTPRANTAAVNLNILWGVSIVDVGAIVFAPGARSQPPRSVTLYP